MACRKQIVENRSQLANLMTKLEGGKSTMEVGDGREFLRKFKELEKYCYLKGYKSPAIMLRREAVAEAEAMSPKQKARARARGVR